MRKLAPTINFQAKNKLIDGPTSLTLERGQGTRPRPVGDTGSVSWRSGQNCAKCITSKQFWVPQEDLTLLAYTTSFQAINKLIGGLPLWFKRGGPPSIYSIIQKICKRVIIHFKKQSPTERWRVPTRSVLNRKIQW